MPPQVSGKEAVGGRGVALDVPIWTVSRGLSRPRRFLLGCVDLPEVQCHRGTA